MGLTRSEYSHFLRVSVFDLVASPPPHLVRVVVDMALETMTQTSKTKSVAISLLKHLIGGPLGTTTTLVTAGSCQKPRLAEHVLAHHTGASHGLSRTPHHHRGP